MLKKISILAKMLMIAVPLVWTAAVASADDSVFEKSAKASGYSKAKKGGHKKDKKGSSKSNKTEQSSPSAPVQAPARSAISIFALNNVIIEDGNAIVFTPDTANSTQARQQIGSAISINNSNDTVTFNEPGQYSVQFLLGCYPQLTTTSILLVLNQNTSTPLTTLKVSQFANTLFQQIVSVSKAPTTLQFVISGGIVEWDGSTNTTLNIIKL